MNAGTKSSVVATSFPPSGVETLDNVSLDELQKCRRFLRVLQAPSASEFWDYEKAVARIDIEIERRGAS